jgi:hypothetical protein
MVETPGAASKRKTDENEWNPGGVFRQRTKCRMPTFEAPTFCISELGLSRPKHGMVDVMQLM